MPSEINLLGWDTAFAISYKQVNEAIVQAKSTPPSFDYTDRDMGVRIQGQWGDWQLTTGGDGQDLQMVCPVLSGEATGAIVNHVDLSDSQLKIQIRLDKAADPAQNFTDPTGSSGTANKLVIKTSGTDMDPAVLIISSQFPHAQELILEVLPAIFHGYFVANIAQFNHIFSVSMLNEKADQGDYQWLKPTDMSYAVADASDGSMDKSVFAVLSMTENKPIGTSPPEIDPHILQDLITDANSAFAISGEKVFEHIFLPGAMAVIQGSKREDFNITDGNLSAVNARDLTWGNFQLNDGKIVTPLIKAGNFRMRLQAGMVLLEITNATCNWPSWQGPGSIVVSMNIMQSFEFSLKQKPDGTHVFVPKTGSLNVKNITVNVTATQAVNMPWLLGNIGIAVMRSAGVISGTLSTPVSSERVGTLEITEKAAQQAEEEAGHEAIQWSEQQAAQAAAQAAENTGKPSFLQKFDYAIAANKWKIFGGVMVALVSDVSGNVAEIIKLTAKGDTTKVPPFDTFVGNCIGATKWPQTNGWQIKDAGLRGPLVVSGKLLPGQR